MLFDGILGKLLGQSTVHNTGFGGTFGNIIGNSFDPINMFGLTHGNSQMSKDTGTGSILGDTWDKILNGNSNDVNYAISQENLGYQKERAGVADQRYDEETAYNRALQERIFEREDTNLLRQASQLSALGINPLSQNMSGTPAGQALNTASDKVAETPQRNFSALPGGALSLVSSMLSLADTFNGLETGKYSRDALALQNDKQFLENLKTANSLGIKYQGYIPYETGGKGYRSNTYNFYQDGKNLFDTDMWKSSSGSAYRQMNFQSMPSWQYTLDQLGQDSIYNQAEKALTKTSKLFDTATTNLFSKTEGKPVWELMGNKFNPITFLLNTFFGM